jgi:hydrogenase-4 component B
MESLDPGWLVVLLAPYVGGALAAVVLGRRVVGVWAAHLCALVGGVIGVAAAVWALSTGATLDLGHLAVTPFADLAFRLDPLGAFFLLVISALVAVVALYAPQYIIHGHGASPGLGVALNAFIASMVLVVVADSVLAFMLAWELMSLVSFFLVMEDHLQPEVRRAGFVYLVMTHVGGAFLLVAFMTLFVQAGGLGFAAFRAASAALPPFARDVVFLAALIGFGTKAGVVPLHVWLPRAHPAAPSHVSALMSGVMVKMGIYGLLRVGWELAGPGPVWWGGLVLTLGAISAAIGVLYAVLEHDVKRLLAYSTVENVGIILMGVGAAFCLASLGQPAAAAFALSAALLHTLNHTMFKGLLFLGAGAVLRAVHTRDLEKLGGLIHRMPWTGSSFLIGAVAISALPPLNGFASEWLTFQSLLMLSAHGAISGIGAAVAAGLLALTGGLAVLCFVKAVGVAFLGMPRSAAAGAAQEVGLAMRVAMVVLAVACVSLGLAPGGVLSLLRPATEVLVGSQAVPTTGFGLAVAGVPERVFNPAPTLGILVGLAIVAWLLGRLIGGPERVRIAPAWVCGNRLEPTMQYTSAAMAKMTRIVFSALIRPYREVERQHSLEPYFVSSVRYRAGVTPIYERYVYRWLVDGLVRTSMRLLAIQSGSLRAYLGYTFVTLIVVLILAR